MGLVGALTAITHQIDLWLMRPDQFVRNPLAWLACFGEHGCTITAAPNLGYRLALKRAAGKPLPFRFDRWRIAIVGAEPVDAGLLAEFCGVFGPCGFKPEAFRPAYGLAEATLAVTGLPLGTVPTAVRLDTTSLDLGCRPSILEVCRIDGPSADFDAPGWLVSAGQPLRGVTIEARDPAGNLLPDETIGEIWVRSPSVGVGYVRLTGRERFTPEGLRTGDAGFLYDGQLYVVGRIADRIKVRGLNVYAEYLEDRIQRRVQLRPGSLVVLPALKGSKQGITVLWERRGPAKNQDPLVSAIAAAAMELVGAGVAVEVRTVPAGGIPRTTSGKPRRFQAWYDLQSGGAGSAAR